MANETKENKEEHIQDFSNAPPPESSQNDTTAAGEGDPAGAAAGEQIDWENDPRIAYNQVTGTWIFEDPDTGAEYEYSASARAWMPVADEGELRTQQAAYGEVADAEEEGTAKRAREDYELGSGDDVEKKRQQKEEQKQQRKRKKREESKREAPRNRGVYIQGLPTGPGTTVAGLEAELAAAFGRYGVIAEDLRGGMGKKHVRVYANKETGAVNGDALVVYFRPESVELAVQMMDGALLRADDASSTVRVEAAQYNPAGKKKDGEEGEENGATEDGEQRKLTEDEKREKRRLQKKYQKMQEKLADWDDDEDSPLARTKIPKRWEKVVILRHVFTLAELAASPGALAEIEEDMWAGAEDIGAVRGVTVYDREPEGVVSIKFDQAADAERCVRAMRGRYFGGRRLDAELYDGKIRYRSSKDASREKGGEPDDGEQDEARRLEEFGQWLEKQ